MTAYCFPEWPERVFNLTGPYRFKHLNTNKNVSDDDLMESYAGTKCFAPIINPFILYQKTNAELAFELIDVLAKFTLDPKKVENLGLDTSNTTHTRMYYGTICPPYGVQYKYKGYNHELIGRYILGYNEAAVLMRKDLYNEDYHERYNFIYDEEDRFVNTEEMWFKEYNNDDLILITHNYDEKCCEECPNVANGGEHRYYFFIYNDDKELLVVGEYKF